MFELSLRGTTQCSSVITKTPLPASIWTAKMGELNFALPEGFPIVYRDEASPERFDDAAWGRVFNERRDRRRRPWAVVGATNPADVKVAVDLANSENRRVSVRSGGHSWAGWSVRDEAILIDFGNHNELSYDETTKIATCSTSTTGRILNDFLKDKGRMFAGGHCPDVGLGGFLLQGGMGWNCKVSERAPPPATDAAEAHGMHAWLT